jgi:NADPH-dependent 2,4-dienoyl-CoA reductase/sulfur reductase-like enzyme
MRINRRHFIQAAGTGLAMAGFPGIISAASRPHILVIGGGFAGATVSKYLRLWSDFKADVSMVDPNPDHVSCVLSNLILNENMAIDELRMPYAKLESKYGVKVIRDKAEEIQGTKVRLANNGWGTYDRVVVATGIGFIKPNGLDVNKTPHAWIAGQQTTLLAKQINEMRPNSTFVMTIPKSPYRCPPGPYERACLVADHMQNMGVTSVDTPSVIVLDANSQIQAERHTFSRAFNDLYGNTLKYIPDVEVQSVNSTTGRIYTSAGEFQGDVLNVIPDNQATRVVYDSGLTSGGNWAPVDPTTYESTVGGFEGVHVIGDSQNTNQPKSAHMANAQAKVCADAIVRSLSGLPTDSAERLANLTTNSACYSPITSNQASWLTANFAYNQDYDLMQLTHIGEAEEWSRKSYKEMFTWANNLFADCFG